MRSCHASASVVVAKDGRAHRRSLHQRSVAQGAPRYGCEYAHSAQQQARVRPRHTLLSFPLPMLLTAHTHRSGPTSCPSFPIDTDLRKVSSSPINRAFSLTHACAPHRSIDASRLLESVFLQVRVPLTSETRPEQPLHESRGPRMAMSKLLCPPVATTPEFQGVRPCGRHWPPVTRAALRHLGPCPDFNP